MTVFFVIERDRNKSLNPASRRVLFWSSGSPRFSSGISFLLNLATRLSNFSASAIFPWVMSQRIDSGTSLLVIKDRKKRHEKWSAMRTKCFTEKGDISLNRGFIAVFRAEYTSGQEVKKVQNSAETLTTRSKSKQRNAVTSDNQLKSCQSREFTVYTLMEERISGIKIVYKKA